MNVFVDTSAFLAMLDRDDKNHIKAKQEWERLISDHTNLYSNNYVFVETFALVQHRLGMKAVRVFEDDITPMLNIFWVTESIHKAGTSAFIITSKKKLSLVDCVSFETMRRSGLKEVFTFDPHFFEQGFDCIPAIKK